MKLFHSRLTKRYVITVLVVILFVLTSLYFIAVNVMNSSVRSQVEERNELIAKTLGEQIAIVLENAIVDMRQLTPIVKAFETQEDSLYQTEIETIISQDPLFLFIEVYKGNEQVLRVPDIAFSQAVNVYPIMKRLSWSKTHYISNQITLPDGRKTIAIAYPAINEDSKFIGTVIAYLNLNILSDYLQKFSIGKDGVNAVVDRNGTIIAHTNKRYIGSSVKDHEVGSHLKKERYGIWKGFLFDETMVVAYRPLLLGKISLIVAEPVIQAMAPARSVTLLLIQGFFIVFIIAIGLALFGASRVVRPVMMLIKQVQEYKEDKRKIFHTVKTNDEMEDLSVVLSDMATALREKERSLFYILESIPYGVITTDKDGKIMTFNKGAEKLTLFNREEAVGKLIFDLPIKKDIREFVLHKTLQEGKEFEEVESYIVDKHEQIHDVRMYASMFTGEEKDYIGSIVVIRDVSELKKLEEYLKQSERLASLGQLTAGIAHEIKNPLSIIQAAAEAIRLQLEDVSENVELIDELSVDILDSADRMNKLLTDFLKLTKNDTQQVKGKFNLIQVTEELIHLLRKKFRDQDVNVRVHYQTDQAIITGDKHKLTQVLLNLFLNSLQAMKGGGAIDVSLTAEDKYWLIKISDTGEGIPEAKVKWIFNPFYSTKPEGTGLGLSIAHEIVMQHGGKIWADSTVGKGTTLSIQLPRGN
jgi:PAS domain S-box-containing protein